MFLCGRWARVRLWHQLEALAAAAERELPEGAVKAQLTDTLLALGWEYHENDPWLEVSEG